MSSVVYENGFSKRATSVGAPNVWCTRQWWCSHRRWNLLKSSWNLYGRTINNIWKKILRIKPIDRHTSLSVLDQFHISIIETMIIKEQLHWSLHLVRRPISKLEKLVLFSAPSGRSTSNRGQSSVSRICYNPTSRKCNIGINFCENESAHMGEARRRWVNNFEYSREQHENDLRQQHKERVAVRSRNPQKHPPHRAYPVGEPAALV